MSASLVQTACGIDMEYVMSFVASSNLTSIAVYLRYTDTHNNIDHTVLAQISIEKGRNVCKFSYCTNGHKYFVMTLSSIHLNGCFPQAGRRKSPMSNM